MCFGGAIGDLLFAGWLLMTASGKQEIAICSLFGIYTTVLYTHNE